MLTTLFFHIRSSIATIFFGFVHLFACFFSKAARRRSAQLWSIISNPFLANSVEMSQLLKNDISIKLGPVKSDPHNVSEYELLCLCALLRSCSAETVFEIGTYDGRTTRSLAMNLPSDGRIYTLNLPPGIHVKGDGVCDIDSRLNSEVQSGEKFIGTTEESKIQQLYGDSAQFDFSSYVGQMDFVFIDGSHTYSYVLKDTETALALVKPSGGWVVWHDAPLYGVAPALKAKIRDLGWPLVHIDGTTLMVGYFVNGEFRTIPQS